MYRVAFRNGRCGWAPDDDNDLDLDLGSCGPLSTILVGWGCCPSHSSNARSPSCRWPWRCYPTGIIVGRCCCCCCCFFCCTELAVAVVVVVAAAAVVAAVFAGLGTARRASGQSRSGRAHFPLPQSGLCDAGAGNGADGTTAAVVSIAQATAAAHPSRPCRRLGHVVVSATPLCRQRRRPRCRRDPTTIANTLLSAAVTSPSPTLSGRATGTAVTTHKPPLIR
jgi:hypothetical protein